MKILRFLDDYIERQVIEKDKLRREEHVPSGKLSASILGNPLQWQILKVIGVPQEDKEEYVLRKFQRGDDVEERLVSYMPGVIDTQVEVEYKNTVGIIDALIDMSGWETGIEDIGRIPHEIKSVSNAKFKRILATEPDKHHVLQACFYAMAFETKYFALDYVASDDYRVESYLFETSEADCEVEKIISKFNEQMKLGLVPEFEAKQKWQENDDYNSYKAFKGLSSAEIDSVLQLEYPEAFKKLKGGLS